MVSRYPFWLRTAAVFQLLTAAVHSLSFFRQLTGTNDTERQLIELLAKFTTPFSDEQTGLKAMTKFLL